MNARVSITIKVGDSENFYYGDPCGEKSHDFVLPVSVVGTIDFNKLVELMTQEAVENHDEKESQMQKE